MRIDTEGGGITLWGDDNKWIIDGSTLMEDGFIQIDMSKFDVDLDTSKSMIFLTLKEQDTEK